MHPKVRPEVNDAYWRLAAERQAIFFQRVRGEPDPWTDDPILKRYRFCNAYRASDRMTQFLIRRVIHGPTATDLAPEDVFQRVVLFRLFSKEETWQTLERAVGGIRRRSFSVDLLGDALDEQRRRGAIYTSAFIVAPFRAYGYEGKHRNYLALVQEMFRPRRLGKSIARARSLRELFDALVEWPMIGSFMGYQLAIDLNYTEDLGFSEDEFTVAGPGARRGIEKVFSDVGQTSPSELILRMVDRQEEEFARLGIEFQDLFGRRLHAIDCQNLFCEVDKYSRVRFPELASDRVRIKQTFRPDPRPLDLFYPPKWGIRPRTETLS